MGSLREVAPDRAGLRGVGRFASNPSLDSETPLGHCFEGVPPFSMIFLSPLVFPATESQLVDLPLFETLVRQTPATERAGNLYAELAGRLGADPQAIAPADPPFMAQRPAIRRTGIGEGLRGRLQGFAHSMRKLSRRETFLT